MKVDTSYRLLLRTPAGVISALSTLGVIAYIIWLFSSFYNPQVNEVLASSALIAINLLVCGLGVFVVFQERFGRTIRSAWLMLTLGVLSYTLAVGIWLYYEYVLRFNPFPNQADIFYTLSYPLTLIGLMLFAYAFVPRKERSLLWLDLGIVIVFFGMVLWVYFITSLIFSTDQPLGEYWAMIYIVGDFLILAAIFTLIQRDLTRVARWILSFLGLSVLFKVLADAGFVYSQIALIPYQTNYLVVLWLCSAQVQMIATARLIASGPDMLNDPPARFSPVRHLFRLALPYLAIIIGLGMLVSAIFTHAMPDPRMVGVLIGAYGLVGLVLLRQYVVLRDNVRLYQMMRRVAWTDSLTGLYNRHFFNEVLPRELERAQRYHHSLSVLLMDIDGFKNYNDTYGHLKGDAVLKMAARLFSQHLRSSDTIARFGGDEFVVILPETNRRRAFAIAERIQDSLNGQLFEKNAISVSIGVASYHNGLSPEQLLDEADLDMYKRKNMLKNKVEQKKEAPP